MLKGKHRVGFEVGRYDRSRALVIDPVLLYSSYFGFEGTANGVAVDDSGSMYVTGSTTSITLPVTPGAFQHASRDTDQIGANAFVAKFNAVGDALVYLTYLGGTHSDSASDVVVDAGGNAYITGSTSSSDFPTTPGTLKNSYGGSPCADRFPLPGTPSMPCVEAFVTKLNSTGTALVYLTFLGGNLGSDGGRKLAVDASGNAIVLGTTASTDFPITPGAFQSEFRSRSNLVPLSLFVSKLNSTASALIYSTYLGGSSSEGNLSIGGQLSPVGLAVDAQGNAYICGTTDSQDFPVTPGAMRTKARQVEGYMTKLNPAGTALVYSTYLGGSGNDGAQAIAVDAQGSAYVTGLTFSTDFPVANAFQNSSSIAPFYRSANAGINWSAPSIPRLDGPSDSEAPVRSMAVAPDAASTLYIGTLDGLFRSVNHGDSWSAAGLSGERVRRLTIDPHTSSTLYASTLAETGPPLNDDIGRLYKSLDGGNSWGASILDGASFNAIAVDPANSSTIYVGAGALDPGTLSGMLKSLDGGHTWRRINKGLPSGAVQAVYDLAIDPTNSSKVYAGTLVGVFKTEDGGESWSATPITGSVVSLQIDPRKPDTLYASTEEGDDNEVVKLPDPDDGRFNPRRRQIQAAGSPDPGLFRTINGGASWSAINNELGSNPFVASIAVDPRNPSTLYIASFAGGFYKSLDRGDNWERLDGLPTLGARMVVLDPQNSFVYASFISGTLSGCDAFITKFDPSGATLVYSTYIGGASGLDAGTAIAIDSAGNAYVAGETASVDFRVTPGAFQTTFVGGVVLPDAFVTKVSRDGSLLYSTYLGGNSYDAPTSIAVDSRGVAYVVGATVSGNFPTVGPFRSGLSSKGREPFIAKLDMAGSGGTEVTAPRITNAMVSGKKLIVVGESFKEGALIMLGGSEQKTANDSQSPSTRLIGKKAGKKVKPGDQVTIQVKNPDGVMSERYLFSR